MWSNKQIKIFLLLLLFDTLFFLVTKRNENLLTDRFFVARTIFSSSRIKKPGIKGFLFQKRHNQTITTEKEKKKQRVPRSKCLQN